MSFDNTRAFLEGWALFNDGDLQRLDETERFSCDAEARGYVRGRADQGSRYHRQALWTAARWLARKPKTRQPKPQ